MSEFKKFAEIIEPEKGTKIDEYFNPANHHKLEISLDKNGKIIKMMEKDRNDIALTEIDYDKEKRAARILKRNEQGETIEFRDLKAEEKIGSDLLESWQLNLIEEYEDEFLKRLKKEGWEPQYH